MASHSPADLSEKQTGPCFWLTICTLLASVLVAVDMLSGLRLPASLFYWLNPVAWISNKVGLTVSISGFLVGIDGGAMDIGSLAGMPIVGSFVVFFAAGWLRWRRPILVFLVWTIPCLCALQFTIKRSYELLAERYHAQGLADREANALSKALFLIQESGRQDPTIGQLSARLSQIQQSSKLGP